MKKSAKIGLSLAGFAVAVTAAVVVYQKRKGIQAVQAAAVGRRDLTSLVSATGEIRPLTYTNVLAEGFGRITEIDVHEGQWVHKGDLLMRVESVQPAADVRAQEAASNSSQAAIRAAQANLRANQAVVAQRQADLDKARFDWEKGQSLFNDKLISRQDYEGLKSAFNAAQAALAAAQAQLAQARAQQAQAEGTFDQARAILAHAEDVLRKTTYRAPIAGMVTYIAVRVGEDVVPGIQNAEGAYLMTISDMSVVTTEVRVDETDIVNVRSDQLVTIQIDALPGKTFTGHVTEVGTQAILRSSGLVTTQTTSGNAEAKDFKVVVTLDHPPKDLLPGLTTTAKIETAHRSNVLAVPIQALVVRTRQQLQASQPAGEGGGTATTMAASPPQPDGKQPESLQGVFVLRDRRAIFVPVQTGIMGVTDIEITQGLRAGDQIVVGSFKTLRTLRSGAEVRIEKAPPTTS
ncbi:MAG TPA: efflux RND transporter periplasmic adaptor subunit [Candidatus Acidoferrales bacterium]|nr:efflux RND transporter periplasmic adaptor subunit [Candidatus Acidoferrales bacterium]